MIGYRVHYFKGLMYTMNKKILKTLAVFGLSLIAWNCSEDIANPQQNTEASATKSAFEVEQDSWLIAVGNNSYLIVPNGTGTYVVTDAYSVPVGTFDVSTKTISDYNGTAIISNVDLTSLAVVHPDGTVTHSSGAITKIDGTIVYDPFAVTSSASTGTNPGTVVTVSSSSVTSIIQSSANTTTNPTVSSSSAKTNPVASSSSQKAEQPASSSAQQPASSANTSNTQCSGQCFDSASGKCVGYHDQLTGSNGEKYAYDESCKLNCYYDPNNKNCQSMTGSTSESGQAKSSSSVKSSSSQQQQQTPSSSSVKSSSSVASSSSAPKSSSSQTQTNTNASAEEAKYVDAGAGGQEGYATRYWDCCMPHCSWPEHGGSAKTCDATGKTPVSNTNGSICSGGQGATCTSQIPIIVSDKLAYAFAATPGNDNTCGKCFALTFTGRGKYETKANHQALKGKTLVVMASNIGYDVAGGQIDVMIPGGGVGLYNGCAGMGWGSQGATYGGLLSDCENEVGYSGDLLTKRKQCLTEKCNSSFANDAVAKEGCLFLATWMEAAGNPTHTYKEVECPAALKAQF